MRICYRWRLHRRHLSMESCMDSLVNIWRTKIFLGKLPDHFTAMLQLAKGLEYIHSQKWIHGDIKPENVLIFKNYSRKVTTLKWAYYDKSLHPEGLKKSFIQEGAIYQKKLMNRRAEPSTNPNKNPTITKVPRHFASVPSSGQYDEPMFPIQLSSYQSQESSFNSINLPTLEDHCLPHSLSNNQTLNQLRTGNLEEIKKEVCTPISIEKALQTKQIYYEGKKSSYWLAPELQGVKNPLSLATFQSDVFAEGLVFGSFLLEVHPFGDEDEEITSNIIKNKPVNLESKLLASLFTDDFLIFHLFFYQKKTQNEFLN
jgi:serine/threonine protein kinase